MTEIWPRGQFSLPDTTDAKFECLYPLSREGFVCTDDEQYNNDNDESDPLHLNIFRSPSSSTCIDYCTFTESSGGRDWPSGSYCILRRGGTCPVGFDEGSIYNDNEDTFNYTVQSGTLPDGARDFTCDTLIHYCCRNDSSVTAPIALPTANPFILLRESTDGCQKVLNMTASLEWLFTDDEDKMNENELKGHIPYLEGDPDYKVFYCYYSQSQQ